MPFNNLFVVALSGLFLSFALIVVTGERREKRAAARREVWLSIGALTLVALSAVAWQEAALRTYAQHEGVEIRGLVMKPVPLSSDHQFTPNGRKYLKEGIIIPGTVGSILIALVAVVSTVALYVREFRRMIVAIWLYAATVAGAVAWFAVWRLFQVVELFI